MPNKLNSEALSHAKRLIGDGDINTASAWDISAEDENRMLGDPPDWEQYSSWHLGLDPDANKESKSAYKYPFGKSGKVYRSALIAIRQRAAQQNDTEIFDAAGECLEMMNTDKEGDAEMRARANSELRLTFDAAYNHEAVGVPQNFSGIAYSGGIIPNYYGKDCIIDMSGLQESSLVFTLVNHDSNQRAGWGILKKVDGALQIEGKFFSNRIGQEIAKEFHEGAPWQMSLGMLARHEEATDRPSVVNGKSVEVDAIFRNPRITEVSFVPAGADGKTSVFSFSLSPDIDAAPNMQERDAWHEHERESDTPAHLQDEINRLMEEIVSLRLELADTRKSTLMEMGLELGSAEIDKICELDPRSYSLFMSVMSKMNRKSVQLPGYLFSPQHAEESSAETDAALQPAVIYNRINKRGVK